MIATPVGELATLGIAKETTFNAFAAPTLFQELEAFNPSTKTTFIMRAGSVGAPGMRPPATGPLESSGSLRVASVSDVCAQLLAYAFGSQSTPAPAPTGTSVNSSSGFTTTATPTSYTIPTSSNPLTRGFAVGNSVQVYTSLFQETVTLTAVTTSSITFSSNSNHVYPSAVTFNQLSTVAKQSTLSFGNLRQLPSFSMEYNLPVSGGYGECVDYTGNVIETAKISLASAKGLAIDYTYAGVNQVKQTSPTAASFSTKNIYTMEAAGTSTSLNGVIIGGIATPPDVKSWDLTLANQIDKSRRSAGSGRLVNGFPLGQRKVTGTMKLGFESEAARLIFWGGPSGPSAVIAGVPLSFTVASQDFADGPNAVPFSITLTLPNVRFSQADVPHKTSGGLEQPVTLVATESVVGAGDDLSAVIVNAQSSIF